MYSNKKKESVSFMKEFQDFTSDTTLHGIKYPLDKEHSTIRRWIWGFVTLGLAAFLIRSLAQSLNKYYRYDSVTSFTSHFPENLSMPAITICPYYVTSNTSINKNYPEEANNIFNYVFPVLYYGMSVEQLPEDALAFIKNEKLMSFYVNTAPNASYVRCRIRIWEVNCLDYLQAIGTDQGICHTFHSEEFIKKNGPILVTKPGPKNGVTILLDAEPDEAIKPLFYGAGFRILVHDPKVYPNIEESSFFVGTGTETFVAVQKSEFKYLRVPYSEKDCINSENQWLVQNYTKNNHYSSERCQLDCKNNIIYDCGCQLVSEGEDSCTLYDFITCASKRYYTIPESYIIDTCNKQCIPNCEETKYTTHVSQMTLPNKQFTQNLIAQNLPVKTNEEISSRYVELKVYYENLRYTLNTQIPATDTGELFSSFGGLMGLFLGASIVTIVEFIDFFVMFLMKKFHNDKVCCMSSIKPKKESEINKNDNERT